MCWRMLVLATQANTHSSLTSVACSRSSYLLRPLVDSLQQGGSSRSWHTVAAMYMWYTVALQQRPDRLASCAWDALCPCVRIHKLLPGRGSRLRCGNDVASLPSPDFKLLLLPA